MGDNTRMNQLTFGDAEYLGKRKRTRREVFLDEMEQVIPWDSLLALIEPVYPKAGRGRRPYPLATMLRIHLMQNWFGLSDPGMEEALYEIVPLRQFARLPMTGAFPDETTLLNFRRLLETHDLATQMFDAVNAHLHARGLTLQKGTIVDATIIHAPSSTKNASGQRDPEMHQTKKGNQWYFGMKAHIGVDADSGLVHTVRSTAANVADVTQAEHLLHGKEEVLHGDSGFTGVEKRIKRKLKYSIAEKRGKQKALPEGDAQKAWRELERRKAQVRAKVEHPFRVIKRQFGYVKVRFKGLAKNHGQVLTLFALSNLWMARRKLMHLQGSCA